MQLLSRPTRRPPKLATLSIGSKQRHAGTLTLCQIPQPTTSHLIYT